jgi:2-haloacid dehalogenase
MSPSVFIFDAYGTLFDVASVTAACASVVPRPEDLVRLWRAKQLEYSFVRSLMGPAAYVDFWTITGDALDYATEALGFQISSSDRDQMLDGWLQVKPYAEVGSALDALRQQGRRCVILSNGTPAMLEAALSRSGLGSHFEKVLSVDAVRVFKPDPRVYALAVDALRTPVGELLFVSSNGWDAAGARGYGLAVAWVNRGGVPIERLGFPPDRTLADLSGAPLMK